MKYLFTSESVSEGHPDKVCDRISDAVVDLYLSKDNSARTAIETLATTNRIVIAGETSCGAYISQAEIEDTVRQAVREIGYDQKGFSWQTVNIEICFITSLAISPSASTTTAPEIRVSCSAMQKRTGL